LDFGERALFLLLERYDEESDEAEYEKDDD
jgi:hypothetical protein